MRRLALLALIVGLLGCAPATPRPSGPASGSTGTATAQASGPAGQPSSGPDRVAGWRADLDALVPAMTAVHPDLFHDTPRAEIERVVADLRDRAGSLSDDELLVGVIRAVALVSAHGRDGHTGLYPWSPASQYPVDSLPLRVWLFPDGIHVIAALAPYEDLVGARVDAIDGHPAEVVVAAIDPLVPRDNEATVRLLTPRYLLIPQVLHGLGLVDGDGPVDLGLVDPDGATRTASVDPIPMAAYNDWAGPYGLFLPADPDVPYLSRMEEPLWWTRLDDDRTLFAQYNRVEFLGGPLVAEFAAEAAAPDVERVVFDIRHNYGGEVRTLDTVVQVLERPAVDRPGRLFLITGRNTFSAASLFAAKLQAGTSVSTVGEPMGGSPNAWGDPEDVTLPWSGLSVSVSTLFEVGTTPDDKRLTIDPDVAVPLAFDDWQAGRDPALAAVLAGP